MREILKSGDFSAPEGWSPVAVRTEMESAHALGLVILAMGKAYWMVPEAGDYYVCVRDGDRAAVETELAAYALLPKRARGSEVNMFELDARGNWWSIGLYFVILIGVFLLQGHWGLIAKGRLDAVAMVEGSQWWRALTALTLHADLGHLVSNLAGGGGFAYLVCRLFGVGKGWCLIVLSGVLANGLTAWIRYPDAYYSIGASTGVFAALGLLTGAGVIRSWQAGNRESFVLPNWMLALVAGCVLLGLLGMGGGAEVDVEAHISGFVVGVLNGGTVERLRFYRDRD